MMETSYRKFSEPYYSRVSIQRIVQVGNDLLMNRLTGKPKLHLNSK